MPKKASDRAGRVRLHARLRHALEVDGERDAMVRGTMVRGTKKTKEKIDKNAQHRDRTEDLWVFHNARNTVTRKV